MTTSNPLTVNYIIPEKRQTGEITFAVVDANKRAAIAFYPASQLDNGTQSTPTQVLEHHAGSNKPQSVPA